MSLVESGEMYRTGVLAKLQDLDRQRERKLAVSRNRTKFQRRGSASSPMLSPSHPLARARAEIEESICTYQALIHLENADHQHHRTMPIPRILKGEASAYATLANVLRMISKLCDTRSSTTTKYKSSRGENSVALFEMATQMCDVAIGIAGSIGCHEVEAFALKSLSDLAEDKHAYEVARHRLDRAIKLIKLIPERKRKANGGQAERLLAKMLDTKQQRTRNDANRMERLRQLRKKLGSAAAVEEKKVTEAFLKVVERRSSLTQSVYEEEYKTSVANTDPKGHLLDSRGFLEWTELMGTYPPMDDVEVDEAMVQISAVHDAIDMNTGFSSQIGLESLIVWWLESL